MRGYDSEEEIKVHISQAQFNKNLEKIQAAVIFTNGIHKSKISYTIRTVSDKEAGGDLEFIRSLWLSRRQYGGFNNYGELKGTNEFYPAFQLAGPNRGKQQFYYYTCWLL